MPRKTASRMAKRAEAEAAEAAGLTKKKAKKKKKATKKRTTRKAKAAVSERKKLVWVIYSGTLKEEAKFPYDQKKEAEEKLEALRAKSKKLYFLQPVKEVLSESEIAAAVSDDEEPDDSDDATSKSSDEEEE